jgi:hypothetical protein
MVLVLGAAVARGQEAPPQGPGTAPGTAGTAGGVADGGSSVRLRQLRQRVEELKGQVFDAKTQLMLLREQILQNLITDARIEVVQVNELSAALSLEEVIFSLDGERIYYQANRDGALDRKEFRVFEGSVSPGNHVLEVEMLFRGNSTVFSYLGGYVFRVKASVPFVATQGRAVRVRAVAFEKGGAATRLEDRPSIRFETQQQRAVESAAPEGETR